jgi:hypothetical protein
MGIEKGSKVLARVLLRFSELKRENLRELGFTEEEVGILVRKFPSLMGLSKDRLRQNLMFLVEEWKLTWNDILIYPLALGFCREKRPNLRFISLKALMLKNASSKVAENYPSARFMLMSDEEFHLKLVNRLSVATYGKEEKNPL